MIKQKLTRAMIVSCMNMSQRGIEEITALRRDLPGHDKITQMQMFVEQSNLQRFYDLMEGKLLKAKYFQEQQTLTISIDPNYAFAFVKYGIIDQSGGYDIYVAERVKEPITKYLLK
ncbi:MAG: hypothetical protein V4721_16445 [Bacteroidota bacterium]